MIHHRSGRPPDQIGISRRRKIAYYSGIIMGATGLIMVLSTFAISVSAISSMSSARGGKTDMPGTIELFGVLVLGGMALIISGNVVRRIGARGLAGSGITLDPDQARQDLKPYATMAGGMIQDVVSEVKNVPFMPAPTQAICIRCQSCRAVNTESAQFCNQCGKPL
jgi:hypothetical protein